MIAAIHLGLEEVSENLRRMKRKGWMGKGIEVGSDENRVWVKDIFSSMAVQNHWMSLAAKHIATLQLRTQGVTLEQDNERRRMLRATAGRSVKTRSSQMVR
mmetsp:Transcript_126387/g.352189  ORF Transcript_126387/g.352189 Transcript_126387/m.352189 type:complete len:101 (+) Transcript_126387:1-303(+)